MEFNGARRQLTVIGMLASTLILSGCLMNDPVEEPLANDTTPATNNAPTISGSPSQSIRVSVNYIFTPTASDPDADPLTFTITNQPNWADFDASTGSLSGMPFLGTEGTYNGIVIAASDGQMSSSLPAFAITVESATVSNLPPQINGVAASSVVSGNNYSFVPAATDPDGDQLTFSITNQPVWASFSTTTGELSGMPLDADVGNYTGITISVSDGSLTASLGSFAVSVDQISLGSVTLNWTPPTQNTDGSALIDLAGYRIYYGLSQGNYPNSIILDNPGLSSYVVNNLAPGTYFFVSTATNSQGVESDFSNVAQKMVN